MHCSPFHSAPFISTKMSDRLLIVLNLEQNKVNAPILRNRVNADSDISYVTVITFFNWFLEFCISYSIELPTSSFSWLVSNWLWMWNVMELYDNFYLNTSCKQNLLLFKQRSIIILTMIKEIERKTKYKYICIVICWTLIVITPVVVQWAFVMKLFWRFFGKNISYQDAGTMPKILNS